MFEHLYRQNPQDEKIRDFLGQAYEHLGFLQCVRLAEVKPCVANLRKSVEIREQFFKTYPESLYFKTQLADAYLFYGDAYRYELNNSQTLLKIGMDTLKFTEKSLNLRKEILNENPSSIQAKRDLAQVHLRMSSHLRNIDLDKRDKNWKTDILDHHQKALHLREEILKDNRATTFDQRNLADQLMMLSTFLIEIGQESKAEEYLRRAEKFFFSNMTADPANIEAKFEYGVNEFHLGKALLKQRKLKEAKEHFQSAEKIAQEIIKQNPASSEYKSLNNLVKIEFDKFPSN